MNSPLVSLLVKGNIGVWGIVVLENFSCNILAILILNCGIVILLRPVGCVF